ncbi:NlpC/P60 family protein [Seinonella peptonophila]|uniref:NlpC/P60 family protein n=1 Tax=Seinonella peptonophila TaxID=112248 RepID=A0A1M5BDJ0_9BACL|nr:C40 family peptidase [Seinonella peptonophila]SHF40407.1 NlpC/P60 family protein [Seinonella peptonophila]
MKKITIFITVPFTLAILLFFTPICLAAPTDQDSNLEQSMKEYNQSQKEAKRLQNKITTMDKKMNDTFLHLEQLKTEQYETQKRYNQILKKYYISRQTNLGARLLGSESLSQFLFRLEYIQLVMKRDQRIIAQYKRQTTQITKAQAQLKKEIAQTKPILQAAEQKSKDLHKKYQVLKSKKTSDQTQTHSKEKDKETEKPTQPIEDQSWLNQARAMIGVVKYRFGASSFPYFDCSSWVQYVFKKYQGINLPRTAESQSTVGSFVSKSNLQPGDLVFFQGTYKKGISHVGIYLGDGYYISNKNERIDLKIESINSSYSKAHYWGAKRVN